MNITFSEKTETNFQVSVIKMLEPYKFTFTPINEYSNDHFYCRVMAPKKSSLDGISDKLNKIFKIEKPEKNPIEFTLALTIYNNYDIVDRIPMVFTQIDVLAIIKDLPNNYVGENVL